MTGGRETVRARGAVNRFTEGYFVIPSTQWGRGPLCSAQIFLCNLLLTSSLTVYGAQSSAPIIYSEFMLWRTHRVFPFVMSLCAQIKLGIMLYLTHNETLSFSAP